MGWWPMKVFYFTLSRTLDQPSFRPLFVRWCQVMFDVFGDDATRVGNFQMVPHRDEDAPKVAEELQRARYDLLAKLARIEPLVLDSLP